MARRSSYVTGLRAPASKRGRFTRTTSWYPITSTRGVRGRRTSSSRYGVAGSLRYVRPSVGRDTPLYVRSIPRSLTEQKCHPIDPAFLPVVLYGLNNPASPNAIYHINIIPQGTGLAEREASRIRLDRLVIRGEYTCPLPNTFNGPNPLLTASFCVVYDSKPTGALPVVTDIFDSMIPFSLQRIANRDRFQILYRQAMSVEIGGPAGGPFYATSDSVRNMDLSIPLNREAVYDPAGTTGSIAEVKSGALYFVMFGPGTASTNSVNVQLQFRLAFHDV